VSEADAVQVRRDGPVTTVLLHRPERRNAVDGPTATALADAFRAFDADEDAGTPDGNRLGDEGDGPMGPTRARLSKPVIAAVSGHAVAGGLELALWCDLRIADETAVFGVFCRRWGVPLIDGGTVRLPRLIGLSRAMDLILTGRAVDAQEALAIGLANRIVAVGQSLSAAQQLAAALARFPQTCLRQDRLSALEQDGMSERHALANELAHGMRSVAESAEGLERFRTGEGRHGSFE